MERVCRTFQPVPTSSNVFQHVSYTVLYCRNAQPVIKCRLSKKGERRTLPGVFFFTAGRRPVPAPALFFEEGERMADYKESDPFYHSAAWKHVRAVALMRDGGMCQDCMDRMRAGTGVRPRRATLVHHIIPRSERPDLELDPDNLRALCAECHELEHPESFRQNAPQGQPLTTERWD